MGNSLRRDAISAEEEIKPHLSPKSIAFSVLSLTFTIVLCLAAIYFKDYLIGEKYIAQYGLLGMLIVAFLGSSLLSIMAVPIPYLIVVFTLPTLLAPQMNAGAPLAVGITSGFGAALGQLLTFVIGCGNRELSQGMGIVFNKRLYLRATNWVQQRGSLAVFLMSVILNPLHLPMTLALASFNFPVWKFFVYSLLGNIVKSSAVAFSGYFGLTWLFHLLGI